MQGTPGAAQGNVPMQGTPGSASTYAGTNVDMDYLKYVGNMAQQFRARLSGTINDPTVLDGIISNLVSQMMMNPGGGPIVKMPPPDIGNPAALAKATGTPATAQAATQAATQAPMAQIPAVQQQQGPPAQVPMAQPQVPAVQQVPQVQTKGTPGFLTHPHVLAPIPWCPIIVT